MKLTNNDLKLLKEKYQDLTPIFKKIEDNYPIQYLIGNVNFYGYKINVNEDVLIPRFETELLVEKTINYINKYKIINPSILDIGTGSGCISIALKKNIECNINALDISRSALKIAKKNASENNVDINFLNKDIIKENIDNIYDVIISNPPYLTKDDDVSKELIYEPQNALYADNDGYIFYENILKKSINHINKKSIIAFEIGDRQGNKLLELSKQYYPSSKILLEKDYTNRDRYIFIISE